MGNLAVGYGRVDITPGYPVPLRGFGNPTRRLSNRNLDPIYVTCLAFSGEDGETVLLYTTDLTAPSLYCNREFRPAVSAATGSAKCSTMSRVCRPMEPVDPKMLIHFTIGSP